MSSIKTLFIQHGIVFDLARERATRLFGPMHTSKLYLYDWTTYKHKWTTGITRFYKKRKKIDYDTTRNTTIYVYNNNDIYLHRYGNYNDRKLRIVKQQLTITHISYCVTIKYYVTIRHHRLATAKGVNFYSFYFRTRKIELRVCWRIFSFIYYNKLMTINEHCWKTLNLILSS